MEPERAFEVNFHLENSEGGQGPSVELKGCSVGLGSPQSLQGIGCFGHPPSQGQGPSSTGLPLF